MFEPYMRITEFSHHFRVDRLTARGSEICAKFTKEFFLPWKTEVVRGRMLRTMGKPFSAADATSVRRRFYRYHINALKMFLEYVKNQGVPDQYVIKEVAPEPTWVEVELPIKEGWVAKDNQVPYIDYLIAEKPRNKLLPLQTGKGKTFCALQAASILGRRVGVFLLSRYVSKWKSDVIETYDIDEKDIVVVEGSDDLRKILKKAKEGKLTAKVIIFSISTLSRWFDMYKHMGDGILTTGYASTPETWFQDLGIGTRIIDEAHSHYHAFFILDMYTHVATALSLTASLITTDPFLRKMYHIQYPLEDRCRVEALHRYTKAEAVHYVFKNVDKIRTTEYGNPMYSHNAFEASIIRQPEVLENYFKLIDSVFARSYLAHRMPGKRAAIFCSSIDMCTRLTEYLKKKYPHLDIRRYVGEDPYENAVDADVRVTTIGSCGTGIDIKKLVSVILTQAISSIQANIQVLGRLREIVGEDVWFHFFTADNIDKHANYYAEKRDMLKERAALMVDYHYPNML